MASSGLVPFARMRDISADRFSFVMVLGRRVLHPNLDDSGPPEDLFTRGLRIICLPNSAIYC